jgi:hypothetical protein
VGTQEGGSFAGGGWQAAAGDVRISYDLGQAYGQGRFEVDVTNFLPCSQPNNEKCHILSMWQGTGQTRDSSAAAGESHWIFRTGTGYFPPATTDCHYKLLTRAIGADELSAGYEARIDRSFVDDAGATYHYALSWDLSGHVVLRRDGTVLYDHAHDAPVRLRYLLVGRDRETKPNYGEQPGVVYKNVKVYVDDGSGAAVDAGGAPPDAALADVAASDAGGGAVQLALGPVDDTYAAPLSPDTVHGAEETLQVGGDGAGGHGRTIYLKFDLRGVGGTIQLARLHLRATNGGGGGALVSAPDSAWSEATLTWNNRPMIGAALYGQLGTVIVDDSYAVDVTLAAYPGQFLSLALISTVEDGAAYGSKENPDPFTRPVLELVYTPGPVPDAGSAPDTATSADTAAATDSALASDSATGTDAIAATDSASAMDAGTPDQGGVDGAGRDQVSADLTAADQGAIDGGATCQRNEDCPRDQLCISYQCRPESVAEPGCGCAAALPGAHAGVGLLLLGLGLRRRRARHTALARRAVAVLQRRA